MRRLNIPSKHSDTPSNGAINDSSTSNKPALASRAESSPMKKSSSGPEFNKNLQIRLQTVLALAILFPVLLIGSISYFTAVQAAEMRLINQLDSITAVKEVNLRFWISTLQTSLQDPFFDTDYDRLITLLDPGGQSPSSVDSSTRELRRRLNSILLRAPLFQDLFILDTSGTVILASRSDFEGRIYQVEPFFQRGMQASSITPPYYFRSINQYAIFISQPIVSPDGDILGVLAGLADFQPLDDLLTNRTGTGSTGSSYLVSTTSELVNNTTATRAGALINSPGVDATLLERQNTMGIYTNTQGKQVIGVYYWLPELEVVLAVEQDRAEAITPFMRGILINLSAAAITLVISMIAISIISRRFANPITNLALTTTKIVRLDGYTSDMLNDSDVLSGFKELESQIKRKDEIGGIARRFYVLSKQLRNMINSMEERVSARTNDIERRSNKLLIAATIAQDFTVTNDLDTLLTQAANIILERFNYYYTGIFLMDERGEYAILRAATGEAGRQMIEKGQRLAMRQQTSRKSKFTSMGIVETAIELGQAQVSHINQDRVQANPLLPYSRSELALPLRVGRRQVGALVIHSVEENAFSEEDISILKLIADQLAATIENARLIGQMNMTLGRDERIASQETWQATPRSNLLSNVKMRGNGTALSVGYRFTGVHAFPIAHDEQRPEATRAMQDGEWTAEIIQQETGQPLYALAVPVRLRDQVIGILNLRFERPISPDTHGLISAAADRLALLLENARLLQDARRLASREQQINLISTQMRASTDIETILQSTVRELGRTLGATRTFIDIGSPLGGVSPTSQDIPPLQPDKNRADP